MSTRLIPEEPDARDFYSNTCKAIQTYNTSLYANDKTASTKAGEADPLKMPLSKIALCIKDTAGLR